VLQKKEASGTSDQLFDIRHTYFICPFTFCLGSIPVMLQVILASDTLKTAANTATATARLVCQSYMDEHCSGMESRLEQAFQSLCQQICLLLL
jgi:hypothetical protein